jgi:hypothetical protein
MRCKKVASTTITGLQLRSEFLRITRDAAIIKKTLLPVPNFLINLVSDVRPANFARFPPGKSKGKFAVPPGAR